MRRNKKNVIIHFIGPMVLDLILPKFRTLEMTKHFVSCMHYDNTFTNINIFQCEQMKPHAFSGKRLLHSIISSIEYLLQLSDTTRISNESMNV